MTRFYKTKIKEYPNGSKVLTVYKNALKAESIPNSIPFYPPDDDLISDEKIIDKELEKMRAIWKIKTKIKDYVLCNDFDCFWTITFGDDRYDYEVAFSKMSKWLRKMKDKYGKFNYIIIPELHKDGAIHFHGVTGGFKGNIIYSGVKHKKVKVYNCVDWEHGFTTITKMRSREKCATYVTKYFTKEMQNSIVGKGKKKYWSSRGLRLPAVTYSDIDLGKNLEPNYVNDVCSIYKV